MSCPSISVAGRDLVEKGRYGKTRKGSKQCPSKSQAGHDLVMARWGPKSKRSYSKESTHHHESSKKESCHCTCSCEPVSSRTRSKTRKKS
jgi:hypothetical protein